MTCYKLVFKDGTIEYVPAYYGVKNGDLVTLLMEHNEVVTIGNVDKLYEIVKTTRIMEVES